MKKLFNIQLIFVIACAVLCAAAFTGCSIGRIKPGRANVSAGDLSASALQSQDPKDPMTQRVDVNEEKIIPAQSVIEDTNGQKITLSAPMPVKTSRTVETKVGASQKNTAQEIAAKLASVRWLQWLGLIVAAFGVASIAYPPLAAIVGSFTTSIWIIVAGAAMIFLPIVIVGHEVLIIIGGGGSAGLWFLAHRHGGIRGELNTLKALFEKQPPTAPPPAPATA